MTDARPLSLGMVVGESSGDLLASALLRGLSDQAAPRFLKSFGIGGPRLVEQGFQSWWPAESLAVNGYLEVLQAYPRLWLMRRDLIHQMCDVRPDVFLGVDAPDFNLGVETALRRAGIRTVHFVSPSIWAWRRERVDRIRAAVDHMLLVFPFERAIYQAAGIPATYVGHPLADQIPLNPDRHSARHRLAASGVPAGGPLIALLPGSRGGEVRHIGPVFLETAIWILERRPEFQFVLPAATPNLYRALQQTLLALGRRADRLRERLSLIQGQSHDVLAASAVTLVASGTASLEAALFGLPMVIAYRMHPLNYRVMRRMAYLPWIGLPNILANESLVPEFVQDAAVPALMGQSVIDQHDDLIGRDRLRERFAEIHASLAQGCAQRSAEVLLDIACR
jgi:lipid-A-disaccharide synthase